MANVNKESKAIKPKGTNSKGDKKLKMQEKPISSYLEDSLYEEFMQAYQIGDWKDGEEKLDLLIENYPLDNDLRHLHQDLLLRSKVDDIEEVDAIKDRKVFRNKVLLGIIGSVAGLAILVVTYMSSATWLEEQRLATEQILQEKHCSC